MEPSFWIMARTSATLSSLTEKVGNPRPRRRSGAAGSASPSNRITRSGLQKHQGLRIGVQSPTHRREVERCRRWCRSPSAPPAGRLHRGPGGFEWRRERGKRSGSVTRRGPAQFQPRTPRNHTPGGEGRSQQIGEARPLRDPRFLITPGRPETLPWMRPGPPESRRGPGRPRSSSRSPVPGRPTISSPPRTLQG